MKVGIVVHSQTGNTRQVAERLLAALRAKGHEGAVVEVRLADGEKTDARDPRLAPLPDLSGYDALAFGAPVHGFSLSRAMDKCLRTLPRMDGRRTACFVTQAFPFAWLGGNRAVGQMSDLLESRGSRVAAKAVVSWAKSRRERTIASALDALTKAF